MFIIKDPMPNTPTIAGAEKLVLWTVSRRILFRRFYDLIFANHCMRKKGDVVFSYNKPTYEMVINLISLRPEV